MTVFDKAKEKKSVAADSRKNARPPWPPLRGGSARRRWGREPCGGQEYFGSWLAKNLIGLLRPYGWFVGNGLDRSVLPCQKYDTARKQRAAGCADGSRPIPTNIPRTPHKANGHGRPMDAPTKNVGADSISARAHLRQGKPPRAHIECAPTDFDFDTALAGSARYNKKRACDILYVTDSWCAVQDSNL